MKPKKQTPPLTAIFVSLLTVSLVGLKLSGFIGWSWWWVFSPVLACGAIAVIGLAIGIATILMFPGNDC